MEKIKEAYKINSLFELFSSVYDSLLQRNTQLFRKEYIYIYIKLYKKTFTLHSPNDPKVYTINKKKKEIFCSNSSCEPTY